MLLDKIAICNMALANIGVPPIQSLDGPATAQRACKLRYDEARIEALCETLWNFSSMWKKGVRLDIDAKPPWQFVFAYPPDALRVFEIQRLLVDEKDIPFEVTDRPDAAGKLIHTNAETPTFIYGRDKEDVSTFDWGFVQALSWLLASKIAMPVTKSMKHQQEAYKMFLAMSSKAVARDLNEGIEDTDTTPTYQAVR